MWLSRDEGNNSSTGSLDEFNIRGGDVGNIGSIAEAAGGTVAGVSEDSDNRAVVEIGVRRGASCG